MILIPLEYLKNHLYLPPLAPSEIAEKLTYYGLETQLVEKKNYFYFEVNPLPNRVDLTCWWGIIQEIKIILNCQKKPFNLEVLPLSKEKLLSVSIATPYCLDFSLVLIKNFKVKSSPDWLKEWLTANRISPVNNLVDSVNLIKLETGQSLRIYDYDALKEKKIVVSKVGKKETIDLPSKKEITLTSGDLVVRNRTKIISLAGIIESEEIYWDASTKNILIEGAVFNPNSIKKTIKHLDMPFSSTKIWYSSLFFSSIEVLQKITSLLNKLQKSNLDSRIIFTHQKIQKQPLTIKVDQTFLEKKAGQKLPASQIEEIWGQLDFFYSKKSKIYQIKVPFYRLDLNKPEDLLEELLRIYDYNRITSSLY